MEGSSCGSSREEDTELLAPAPIAACSDAAQLIQVAAACSWLTSQLKPIYLLSPNI